PRPSEIPGLLVDGGGGGMRVHLKDIVSVGCVVALILAGLCLAAATESSVDIRVFRFAPGRMEVKAGSRVMWANRDDITHTVTSGTPESPDGLFSGSRQGRRAHRRVQGPRGLSVLLR